MGFELNVLAENKEIVSSKLEFNGQTVNYKADLNGIQLDLILDAEAGKNYQVSVNLLTQSLVDWDVTLSGEPLLPTEANLSRMPLNFIIALVADVMELVTAGKKRSA